MLYGLTCTSGRPVAFAYLVKWVERFDDNNFKWVIVSDDYEDYKFSKKAKVIKRQPSEGHSFCQNLIVGLEYLQKQKDFEAVSFWEDDDYYRPGYTVKISQMLRKANLVGFNEDAYYYVLTRQQYRCHNQDTASLAATACTKEVVPLLLEIAAKNDPMMDIPLWQRYTGRKKLWHNFWFTEYGNYKFWQCKLDRQGNAVEEGPFHVGIKQNWHKGKQGISEFGHVEEGRGGVDWFGHIARKWFGNEASNYLKFTDAIIKAQEETCFVFRPLPDREGVLN